MNKEYDESLEIEFYAAADGLFLEPWQIEHLRSRHQNIDYRRVIDFYMQGKRNRGAK